MKRIIVTAALAITALIIGLIIGLIGGLSTSQATSPTLTWNIGTARPASMGSAWAFVTATPHVPQGFGTPTCNPTTGALSIPYLNSLTTIVGSAVMTDEDWTREGIIAGASVGIDHVDIYFTKITSAGPAPITCAQMDAIGNVWIQVEGT